MIQSIEELDLHEKRKFEFVQRVISIANSPSDAVAAQVVAFRVIGIGREFALICMSELARRRELGEDFDFENYIERETKKIPKPAPQTDFNPIKTLMNIKSVANLASIVSQQKK